DYIRDTTGSDKEGPMTPRLSRLSRGAAAFAALLLLAGVGGQSLSAPLPRPKEQLQPLPRELVAAWTKAGATAGWMIVEPWAVPFREAAEGKRGEVPAFVFGKWPEGVVGQLPQPQRAFGLVLRATQVTNADLKELAGLKELQVLNLNFTPVTGTGLKEL